MSLKKKVLFLFVLLSSLITFAQADDINYQHKSLVKSLKKAGLTHINQVNEIELPDSISKLHMIKGKFFQIDTDNVSKYKYVYIGRVNSCRAGGCSISNNSGDDANSEYFDYFILFDENKIVKLVKIFNYQATHGQEVTSRGWLKQFIGHDNSEELQVDKNIDSISGATISVYAITQDVEEKTILLHVLRG